MEKEPLALSRAFQPYRYLIYKLRSRHRYGRGVHPPFAYNFIREVFFGEASGEWRLIEKIRRDMLSDRKMLRVEDHGAGPRKAADAVRSVRDIARHTALPRRYGPVLARMLRYLKPPVIIELGTGTGIASLYMNKGWPYASLVTCEGCPAIGGIADANFKRADMAGIELRIGRFDELLPGLLEDRKEGSFMFIDGDHRQEGLIQYVSAALESGLRSQVIAMDDINWSPGMRKAWEILRKHPRVSLSIGILVSGSEIQYGHYMVNY